MMESKCKAVSKMMLGLGTLFGVIGLAISGTEAGTILSYMTVPVLLGGIGVASKEEDGKIFAKKYLLSYVLFGILLLVIEAVLLLKGKIGHEVQNILEQILYIFTGHGEGLLWIPFCLGVSGLIYAGIRKKMGIIGMIIVSFVGAIVPYFLENMFGKALESQSVFLQVFLLVAVALWRSVAGLIFVFAGEMAYALSKHWERKIGRRILFGILLVVISIAFMIGVFMLNGNTIYNRRVFEYKILSMGVPGLFYGAGILVLVGCILLCSWIGILRIMEFVGDNAVVPLATFLGCRVLYFSEFCARKVFMWSDNNFLTAVTEIVVIIGLEGIGMLLYAFVRKKSEKKPTL